MTPLRKRALSVACGVSMSMLAIVAVRTSLLGQTEVIGPTDKDPISVFADYSQEWHDGDTHVAILRGHCRVVQGDAELTARKMVIWRTTRSGRDRIAVYLEDNVRLERPGTTSSESTMFIDLISRSGVSWEVRHQAIDLTPKPDPLFDRALVRRNALKRVLLQQTQFVVPGETEYAPELVSVQVQPPSRNLRRIQFRQRSALPFTVHSERNMNTTPPEQVTVITGGVILLVENVGEMGTIDLAADRIVVWTESPESDEWGNLDDKFQSRDTPLQVYLEGNIVIRNGDNLILAERAYYDVREDRGLMYDAEIRAYIPEVDGTLRIRASRLRQQSQKSYHAQNAWASTSQFGRPGYRIQSSDIFLEHIYTSVNPWTGLGPNAIDPATGAPRIEEVPWITSWNNTFLLEEIPLFYSPQISGPAEDPNIPLRSATFQQDRIFGTQFNTVWDLFKILGIDEPPNTEWNLLVDYMSERGPGFGTSGDYAGVDLFGLPGPFRGKGLGYYQYDDGRDNLGLDRRDLIPKDRNRGRMQLYHRHDVPGYVTLFGEVGYVSDRNYLEQYFENEFDEYKDQETLFGIQQHFDNYAWSILARPQVNAFENTTEWLPRGDLYALGEPLFGGLLTFTSHTMAGYGKLRRADAPTDPTDISTPLPFVANVDGAVVMSRNELDLPVTVGPFHFVPYVWGEAAYWGEDLTGSSLRRYVGSAGARASVMMWRVFPNVFSPIFNLQGLAHKMVFDADYSYIDSTEALAGIAQYNEFDDNSQERFRERFITNTYSGMIPPQFLARPYAVRAGGATSVTAPYHELVDDLQVLRMGWRHRLQTKVGPPDRLRTRDWMTLDLEASYFPDPGRDNFGETFGLLGGRYKWQISDRNSIVGNATYDLFDGGQEYWNAGVLSQRSARGSFYVGVQQVKGMAIDSQILTGSFTYAMSPKWVSTLGTAYDLAEGQDRGQSITISRIGADFVVHFGFNADVSKNNAGVAVSVEPLFGPFNASTTRLSSLLGMQ